MPLKFVRSLPALLMLSFVAALSVGADTPDKGKNKNDTKGGGDVARYLADLRRVFAAWDTNDDKSVDRDELARACRGLSARAFDPERDAGTLAQLPDYHLFKLLDTSGDWTITKAEFDAWARGHAQDLAEQEQALERLAQKIKQAEKADKKAKNYQKLKADLKREKEAVDRLQDKIRDVQRKLQQMKRDDRNDNKKKGK